MKYFIIAIVLGIQLAISTMENNQRIVGKVISDADLEHLDPNYSLTNIKKQEIVAYKNEGGTLLYARILAVNELVQRVSLTLVPHSTDADFSVQQSQIARLKNSNHT